MKPRALIFLSLPLLLGACAQRTPADPAPVSPAAKVTGPPESCLSLVQFNETRVRNDQTIDFIGAGKRVWRNTLPNRCSGLKSSGAFSYETSLTRLCDTDIIYVLHTYGGKPSLGAGCGLGQFVPVELER